MKLRGQVAVVVGGGQGVGRAIAILFAQEGADVVLIGRTERRLCEAADEIARRGGRATAVVADATDETQVKGVVEETIDKYGKIDILVNSAGYRGPTLPVQEIEERDWDEVLAINLKAPFLCCKAVLKWMIRQGSGNIINISGTAGKEGFPNRAALSAAKWGLEGLTRTIAMEAGPSGVRANVICPGGIYDEGLRHTLERIAAASGVTAEEVERSILERTPLRRFASLEETARVALFLASNDSSHITGESINVSGGYIMH